MEHFIPLTLEDSRRTFHVRTDRIIGFTAYVDDKDENLRFTEVVVEDGNDLHVLETPEEIACRIKDPTGTDWTILSASNEPDCRRNPCRGQVRRAFVWR